MTIGQHYDKQQAAADKTRWHKFEPASRAILHRHSMTNQNKRTLSVEFTAAADKCEIVMWKLRMGWGKRYTMRAMGRRANFVFFLEKKRVFRYLQTCSMERRCPDKSKYTHNTQHSVYAFGEKKGLNKKKKAKQENTQRILRHWREMENWPS